MPRWSLDGCLGFCVVALGVVGLLTVPLYCEHRSGQGDDPYFQTAPCPHNRRPDHVEVTESGFSPSGCVRTDRRSYRFLNRLTGQPVPLCLGRRGTCVTGHDSPFDGGRMTLGPGESREVRFSYRISPWWINGVARNYPVTVLQVPGLRLAATDIVVRREVPVTD